MKKLYIYTIISAVILAMAGCTQIENVDQIPEPTVRMTITASTEGGDETKALMGDDNEDGSRSILWEPEDSIRILYTHGDIDTALFINKTSENNKIATFEGELRENVSCLLASYPYSNWIKYQNDGQWNGESWTYESYYLINLPKTQVYRENNFDRKAFPMVCLKDAEANATKVSTFNEFGTFEFKNLCGVLALNLVGEISVRSITMTATTDSSGISTPANLSGSGIIKEDINSYYILDMNSSAWNQGRSTSKTVTLECPDVQLDPDIPTPFHIVLPPATYSSFSLSITTTDGRIMLVNVDKELVINRSKAKHTTPLTYTETIPLNLSERGTSNCYIVSEGGAYKFDASVIGNGKAGIIEGVYFHTTDPSISPSSAELLWESPSGLISGLGYNSEEKTISFIASTLEGNALIAAKDESGEIIWSWHIWCTDKPKEQTYINYSDQTFSVQDRNLGATSAEKGKEDWYARVDESIGLHYQWGRKDPFNYNPNSEDRKLSWKLSIEESIKNPTRVSTNDKWMDPINYTLWTDSLKTIYDPCPVGYKVPPRDVWTGFTSTGMNVSKKEEINASGDYDCGWNFIYDGTNTTWYPATLRADVWSGVYNQFPEKGRGSYWSSSTNSWNAHALDFYYGSDYNLHMNMSEHALGHPYSVRCVADEGYVDTSLPTLSTPTVSNIGNTTATFSAEATDQGGSAVIQKGFVWSKSHKPTVDLPTKIIVSSDTGKYSANISNLEQMSGYYVRAFATNSHGTGYSEEFFFSTKYDGIPTNLSNNGTSNCYIVSEEGYYGFDASIIGNGSKGIIPGAGFHTSDPSISPVTAEIVWEDTEDLITYIYFDDAKKSINFWASGKEGNALIAAKDGDGSIVWSWHIWSTDKPADHSYFNHNMKNYIVMDRNIGATRADRGTGDQWKESAGLVYQWGRKDPFAMNRYTRSSGQFTIAESILKPNDMPRNSSTSDWSNEPWEGDYRLWTDTLKTIYDPCPLGYRIPATDVWTGFTTTGESTTNQNEFNISGTWDFGYNFIYDGTNTAWYPVTFNSDYDFNNYSGTIWIGKGDEDCGRNFSYNSSDPIVCDHWWSPSGLSRAVRCVKDQVYNDPSMPNVLTTGVSNITESQAKFTGEVTTEGTFGVSERGFVWNINADGKTLNVDTANKEVVGSGMGSFETTVISLKPGTNYFFRSYAISTNGTVYGETLYFKTKETGSNEDLGEDEHEW